VDLHFLRYQREAELLKKFPNMKIQRRDLAAEKQAELDLVRQSDVTIVVSDAERNVLTENVPDAQIVTIPLYRQVVGAGNTYSQRANIGFIGGYQHPPNIDAVMHFAKKVWPKLCKQLGNCKFIIAGSDMPQEILQLAGEHIEVRGYIEDLSDFFEELRIMVAPLRYGAGIKGKIVSGLCHGVPQVVSRVAAEGMGLSHGQEVLIAADDQQYADLIMQLYNDSALWAQMSEQAIAKAHAAYSSAAVAGRVSELLTQLLADRPRSEGVNP
jgi:glycosyltransferase involved in cell wall biosynthesis